MKCCWGHWMDRYILYSSNRGDIPKRHFITQVRLLDLRQHACAISFPVDSADSSVRCMTVDAADRNQLYLGYQIFLHFLIVAIYIYVAFTMPWAFALHADSKAIFPEF